ncbi:MAG: TonB-dependent receptor [Draconibacterium sp.]
MKKKSQRMGICCPRAKKLMLTMRLTILFIAFSILSASASVYSQNTTLTVKMKNSRIADVFDKIEQQTEFYFFYNRDNFDDNRLVSVDLEEKTIEQILDKLFEGQPVTYEVVNKNVLIKVKSEFSGIPETQQQRTVSGKVSDSDGEPLPGVTVVVKGTTQGTVTNADGEYTLTNLPEDATLVFSFVGMQTKEIEVGNQNSINITLEVDAIGIEEVVAIGYGTQKKVNVIGSVAQISSENLKERPVTQLSNILAGQMSGVTVIQGSGKPGETNSSLRIRGVGSFGASPNALVLVDGLPTDRYDNINPNDIETISVLKDASTAAIFVARAANGVVLITTKKGKEGKFSVRYDGRAGISVPTELPKMANSWEYAEMMNIAVGAKVYSDEDIAKFESGTDIDNYPNTNWFNEVFKNGTQQDHNISLSGGTQANKYFASFNYLNQTGVVDKNGYDRYSFRLNTESMLGKKVKLSTIISGIQEKKYEPVGPGDLGQMNTVEQIITNTVRIPSIYTARYTNGEYGSGLETFGTPVSWIGSESFLKKPEWYGKINARLDWTPFNNLTVSAIGGYSFNLLEWIRYKGSQVLNSDYTLRSSNLYQDRDKEIYKTMQYTAEYIRDIKDHQLKFLAGYSFEDQVNDYMNGYRMNFATNTYTVLDMGAETDQQTGGNITEWALQSLFGRLNYNYKQKYLLESTVRHDGSSRFPTTRRYAFFPSVAAGWRISEENFIKENPNWISNLKLKASAGVLGNQNIGNYPYQATYASGWAYPIGDQLSSGVSYTTYTDPNIHWESTRTMDIGIESGFFDQKLTFNVSYFDRHTSDILYAPSSSVSSVIGVGIGSTNTGEAKNKGWEFEVGHQLKFGDFSYNLNGNLSIINNKVVTLGVGNVEQPNGMVGNGSDLFIGYPMQMYYGYKSDGVFLDQDDIDTWSNQSQITPTPQAGDIRYMDISGPDGVPDGKVTSEYDRTYLGSRIPKYTFSFNVGTSYKNLDLGIFLQGVAGVNGLLNHYAGYAFSNDGSIQQWMIKGRFNPENPVRHPDYPRLQVFSNTTPPNYITSDFWILNASYLRLKNVQVGYTFPKKVTNAIGVDYLRLYCTGENLFTFKSYREGWDPEINTSGAYYPILSTFTLGVNVQF